MTNGYNYDSITNTLTVSAAFLKKAGVLNSPEYVAIKQFRTDYPNITIKKAAPVVKKNAEHHIKMTHMEEVLKLLDKANGTKYIDQYGVVKQMSKIHASPYKYVETWFKNLLPDWENMVTFDENGKVSFVKNQEETPAEAGEVTELRKVG